MLPGQKDCLSVSKTLLAYNLLNSITIVITQHTLAKFSHILYINYHAFVSSDHTGHARIQRGGRGGTDPSLEFAKLNTADITGNEKISYFSYLCISTVTRRTESIHKITIK